MASCGAVATASRSTISAAQIYQNGNQYVTNDASRNIGFYGAQPWITMGDPTGNANAFNAAFTVTVAYYWNRLLTAGEMRYLDANPYSLLLWSSDLATMALAHLVGGISVTADFRVQSEILARQLRDSNDPLEFLLTGSGGSVTGDSLLPIEILHTVRQGRQTPIEFDASIIARAPVPPAIYRRFSRPGLTGRVRRLFTGARHNPEVSLEFLGQARGRPIPIEWVASAGTSIDGDSNLPVEVSATLIRDSSVPVEILAAAMVTDQTVPIEVIAKALRDAAAPIEALGQLAQISDSLVPVELLATRQMDTGAPLEKLTSMVADPTVPVEIIAGMMSRSEVPAEIQSNALTAMGDSVLPIESVARVAEDQNLPFERPASFLGDTRIPLEAGAAQQSDSGAPIEDLAGLAEVSNSIIPLEWSGTLAAFVDAMIQIENLASPDIMNAALVEWLGQSITTTDSTINIESVIGPISADVQIVTEWLYTAAGSIDPTGTPIINLEFAATPPPPIVQLALRRILSASGHIPPYS